MSIDLPLLLLRVVLGLVLAAHGAQKLFGWFGGPGLSGTTAMFGSYLRLRPAPLWAFLGSATEFGGGLLLALGLLGPLGPASVVAAMLMALTVHWPRFWAQDGGIEYPLVLLFAGLALAVAGPGAYSLDATFGIQLQSGVLVGGALVAAALGAGLALATRAPAPLPEVAGQEAVAQEAVVAS